LFDICGGISIIIFFSLSFFLPCLLFFFSPFPATGWTGSDFLLSILFFSVLEIVLSVLIILVIAILFNILFRNNFRLAEKL
jgi:hypothetical protein